MEKLRTSDLPDRLQKELASKFAINSSNSLETTCAQGETFLLDFARDAVIQELKLELAERDVNFKVVSPKRFLFKNEVYEIKITEYAYNDNILQIAIRRLNSRASKLLKRPLRAKIDSLGRYAEFQVFIEQALAEFQSTVGEVCVVVLEAGYRWLAEYVRTALDGLQNRIADDLYSHLRQLFSEELVENIFLFGIVDKSGIYLLDDLGRRAALERAARRKVTDALSPIEVVTNFSTTVVELERLLSKKAIAEDITLEGSFLESAYAETGLNLSAIVIYESSQFVVQPVVREGNTLLVAAYPPKIRSSVEPILQRTRRDFERITEQGASTLRTVMRNVLHQGSLPRLKLNNPIPSWQEKTDYLELKPNVFGIGINLNNIMRDLFAFYRREKK